MSTIETTAPARPATFPDAGPFPDVALFPEPASPDAPSVAPPIHPDDVEVGDVVFTARPGFLQDLCTRAGEPWRHVGLAVEDGGRLGVAEVAGVHFRIRPFPEVAATSEAVAVARLPAAARSSGLRAARWCAARCGDEQVYAWDDLVLAGFISATRLYCPDRFEADLAGGVGAAVARMRAQREDPTAGHFTCSSFVATAFSEVGWPITADLSRLRAAGDRPPLVDLLRRRARPLRSGHDTRMTSSDLTRTVRALVAGVTARRAGMSGAQRESWIRWITPGDIWRSETFAERFPVELIPGQQNALVQSAGRRYDSHRVPPHPSPPVLPHAASAIRSTRAPAAAGSLSVPGSRP